MQNTMQKRKSQLDAGRRKLEEFRKKRAQRSKTPTSPTGTEHSEGDHVEATDQYFPDEIDSGPVITTPEPSHLLSNGIGDDQDNSNHLAQSETPDLDVGKSEQPKAETASAVTPILSWSMFGTAAHEAGQSDTPVLSAEKKSEDFLKDISFDGCDEPEPQVESKKEVWSDESGLEQPEDAGIESSRHVDDSTPKTATYLSTHTVHESKNLEMSLDYKKPTEEIDYDSEDESGFDTIPLDNEQGILTEKTIVAPTDAEFASLEPNGQEQVQAAEMAQDSTWVHQSQDFYTNGSMENDKLSAQNSTFPDQASDNVQPHVTTPNPVIQPSRHTRSEKVSDAVKELNKVALELLDSLAKSQEKFAQLKTSEERSKSQVQALSLELQEQYDALDEERSQKENDKNKLSLSSLAINQLVDAVAQLEHYLRVVQENIDQSKSLDSQVASLKSMIRDADDRNSQTESALRALELTVQEKDENLEELNNQLGNREAYIIKVQTRMAELNQLELEHDELQQAFAKKQSELQEAHSNLETLREELKSLQTQHDAGNDSSTEIKRLYSEIERVNGEKEQLEVKLRSDDSKLQVSSLSRQVEAQKEEIRSLKKCLEETSKETGVSAVEEEQVAQLKLALEEKSLALQDLQASCESYKETLAKYEKDFEEVHNLQAELEQREQDIKAPGRDVADEIREKNAMITQLSEKNSELEASCQEYSQAAEELLQLRSAMKSKEEEMESLRRDIASLQNPKGAGEESIDSMQMKMGYSAMDLMQEYEKRVVELESDLAAAKEDCEATTEECRQLSDLVEQRDREVKAYQEALRARSVEADSSLREVQQEREELIQLRNALQNELSDVKTQLKKSQESEERHQQLVQECAALSEELKEKQDQLQKLEEISANYDSLLVKHNSMQAERLVLLEQCEKLKSQVENKSAEAETAKELCEDLENALITERERRVSLEGETKAIRQRAEATLHDNEQSIANYKKEVENLREQLHEFQHMDEELANLKRERSEDWIELDQVMERGAKTEQEIKDLRDNERQLQLRIAQAEEDKTSIMTEAERVIEEIEILKENFEQAKVDNARHQELAKELTTEVQGLTDELREAADENVKLRTEVQVLLAERKEAKVLKQEIDRLRDEQPMSPNMKQKIVRLKESADSTREDIQSLYREAVSMKKSFMQMSSKVRFACASATQRAMPAEGGGDATSAASESQLAKLKSELEAEQKKRATAEMALKAQMAAIKSASSRPSEQLISSVVASPGNTSRRRMAEDALPTTVVSPLQDLEAATMEDVKPIKFSSLSLRWIPASLRPRVNRFVQYSIHALDRASQILVRKTVMRFFILIYCFAITMVVIMSSLLPSK